MQKKHISVHFSSISVQFQRRFTLSNMHGKKKLKKNFFEILFFDFNDILYIIQKYNKYFNIN